LILVPNLKKTVKVSRVKPVRKPIVKSSTTLKISGFKSPQNIPIKKSLPIKKKSAPPKKSTAAQKKEMPKKTPEEQSEHMKWVRAQKKSKKKK
jgi:hypothetical protein